MKDQDILKIAELARLDIQEHEIKNLREKFLKVKEYIDLISGVDCGIVTENDEPLNLNIFHDDVEGNDEKIYPAEFSHHVENQCFKVPKIIE